MFQDSDSGEPEEVDLDSSFESSDGSDIEVCLFFLFFLNVVDTCLVVFSGFASS